MAHDVDVATLRAWLLKRPRPEVLRLTCEDGEQRDLSRTEGASWQEVAQSIAALDPVLIEAINAAGKSLRAIRADELERGGRQRDNERVPPPPAIHSDPETARLCYMADLLHRAYQHSTDVAFEKVANAYDQAFQRLVDITERMDARSEAIEKRLERAESAYRRELQDRLDEKLEAVEQAAQANGGGDGIVQNFVSGLISGQAMGAGAPKPNGKGDA